MNNNVTVDWSTHWQNFADCVKTLNNIGGTTYQNICDGSSREVAWGSNDWFWNGLGTFLAIGAVIFVLTMVGFLIRYMTGDHN